jgi:hypothetical protein
VTLDIGVELGGEEMPADLVGLKLGHVDAVGGKSAQRLVERRRDVAHPKQECGDHQTALGRDLLGIGGQNQEPGGVMRLVLDVGLQHFKPVDVGRQRGCDRRAGLVAGPGKLGRRPAVSAATTGLRPSSAMALRHWPRA